MEPHKPTPSLGSPAGGYEAGQVIGGKYLLEHLLGEGGMGSVWCARNIRLDAQVAIKFVSGLVDREGLKRRLIQEARTAARLRHPAIVRVHDVGQTEQGEPFVVMELLTGYDLGQRIRESGRRDPRETVQLLLPIADGLAAAHLAGIVHRDVKPDNVFVVDEGRHPQPKLVDFGAVKVDSDGQLKLTQIGVYVGTPAYMSPEQARGRQDIDYLTDIWSFSVLLYEAASGHVPFEGENYNELLSAIVEDTPPTLAELGVADAELSRIVEMGMRKMRVERWVSMSQLGAALATWLVAQGIHEDVTGASLESQWLGASDARPLRVELPGLLARAPPDQVSSSSGVRSAPEAWGKRMFLALLAGAVLVALFILVRSRGGDAVPRSRAELESPPIPVGPAAEPATPALVAPEPERDAPDIPEGAASAAPKTTRASRASPRATSRIMQPSSSPPATAPAEDLVNPY